MATKQNSNVENTTGGSAASTEQAKTEKSGAEKSDKRTEPTGGDTAAQVGGVLRGGDTGAVKNIYDKAKESGGQIADQAKDKASSVIDEQKSNLAAGLGSVAGSIRQFGENLRGTDEKNSFVDLTTKYGDNLAQQVEKVSEYLERNDVRELVRDVETFARRNPAIFIGAAFTLGVLAARFLKTSNPNRTLQRRSPNQTRNTNASSAKTGSATKQNSTEGANSPSV